MLPSDCVCGISPPCTAILDPDPAVPLPTRLPKVVHDESSWTCGCIAFGVMLWSVEQWAASPIIGHPWSRQYPLPLGRQAYAAAVPGFGRFRSLHDVRPTVDWATMGFTGAEPWTYPYAPEAATAVIVQQARALPFDGDEQAILIVTKRGPGWTVTLFGLGALDVAPEGSDSDLLTWRFDSPALSILSQGARKDAEACAKALTAWYDRHLLGRRIHTGRPLGTGTFTDEELAEYVRAAVDSVRQRRERLTVDRIHTALNAARGPVQKRTFIRWVRNSGAKTWAEYLANL